MKIKLAVFFLISLMFPLLVPGQDVFPVYSVAEFALTYNTETDNPFQDVDAMAEVLSPAGKRTRIFGFYDGNFTWKFRVVPTAQGKWSVTMRLIHAGKTVAESTVPFTCKGVQGHGFVRISDKNRFRFEWDDNTPYYPIGIQPGVYDGGGLDGGRRNSPNYKWRHADMPEYLEAFEGKANLFRIQLGVGTKSGMAKQILTGIDGLYTYDLEESRRLDDGLNQLRKHGFGVILIPFQDMSLWGNSKTAFGRTRDLEGWKNINNAAAVKPVKPYLKYLVARYSAYVDIWEIFNEDSYTPNNWLRVMSTYIRDIDPYDHIITTNYERPTEDWCEIVTPHEYMWMPAETVDAHLCHELLRLKSFNKPVLYTEFGNQKELSNRDPVKWRIATWVAFMNECHILFWHMGGVITSPRAEGNGNANAYLGPEARKYFGILQDFTKDLPVTLRPVQVGFGEKNDEVYRYALSDGDMTILYLHHCGDHYSAIIRSTYLATGSGNFHITWINPASGEVVKTDDIKSDGWIAVIKSPSFVIDIAARIVRIKNNAK